MKDIKGIIIAAGLGTRMFPMTDYIPKALLPLDGRPMIYHQLEYMYRMGILDVLVIVHPDYYNNFINLSDNFFNYNHVSLNISIETQATPRGIADAFIIGREFIGDSNVCLMLGDNIIIPAEEISDEDFQNFWLLFSSEFDEGIKAKVAYYQVDDPSSYGVFKKPDISSGSPCKFQEIVEKPVNSLLDCVTNLAVVGFYLYDNSVVGLAANLMPSARGELEITDINNIYAKNMQLDGLEIPKDKFFWIDVGTPERYSEAIKKFILK